MVSWLFVSCLGSFISSSEWTQKALQEEQKKKEEEKRKKEEEKKRKKEEEKEKKKQQQLLQGNGGADNDTASVGDDSAEQSPSAAKPMKKNFASIDCGAKVISANPEASGAGNVISTSK